jgi:hypothetical protein
MRQLCKGNEAIVKGAILAGCQRNATLGQNHNHELMQSR